MRDRLFQFAYRLYPALADFHEGDRFAAAGYVLRAAVFALPSLAGVMWLISQTDVMVLVHNWLFLLLLLAFMFILSHLWLELHYMDVSGGHRSDRRSFWGEAMWSGVLVLGPSVVWLGILSGLLVTATRWHSASRLQRVRMVSQTIFRFSVTIPSMVEVAIYRALGGVFPLPGLSLPVILPAVIATVVGFSLGSAMIGVSLTTSRLMGQPGSAQRLPPMYTRSLIQVSLIGPVAGLVAIMPAGLYSLVGPGAYFTFQAIMVGGVFLIDRLARTAEGARQRTQELTRLEQIGQAIIRAPLDGSGLPGLLAEHVPSLFPACQVAIHLNASGDLLIHPAHWKGPGARLWRWKAKSGEARILFPGEMRPWKRQTGRAGILIVPIFDAAWGAPIGRIYLERMEDPRSVDGLMPAAQSLAGQIASAMHNVEVYQQTLAERLARERVSQELSFAGQIQTSFLPRTLPSFDGFEVDARLEPARETSGDFFDVIQMWDGRLGVVIADVSDKGLGAALMMALCRTLIRVYAVEYSTRHADSYAYHPERVVTTVNHWIVDETSSDLFVTLFYGIYDPDTHMLTYANAGHNPPLLYRPASGTVQRLTRTGLPVGLFRDRPWERAGVEVRPEDVLVLYTDGITEAMNETRDQFGEERLHRAIRSCLNRPAQRISKTVLRAVSKFVGDAPRSDDITLIVVRWTAPAAPEEDDHGGGMGEPAGQPAGGRG